MENFFTSFESFLTNPALQKYIENPSTGISYNFELNERFSTDTRYKNWPSVDIIFGGAGSNYKGTLNNILSQVENGMDQVKLYTQVYGRKSNSALDLKLEPRLFAAINWITDFGMGSLTAVF